MQDEVGAMRIDFQYTPPTTTDASRSHGQTSAAANQAGAAAESGEDRTSLSSANVQIAALSAQASQLPEIREQRVQALRQAMLSGQYRPDPQQVAGALMTHMTQSSAA